MWRTLAAVTVAGLVSVVPVFAGPENRSAGAAEAVPSGQDPAVETPPATPVVTEGSPHGKRPSLRDDKRRTMRGYGSNLWYNLLGVATRGNHEVLLVTTAITLPALAWDDEGIKFFEQHPHHRFGRFGASLGGSVAVGGLTIGFFSAGRIVSGERFRATTYDLSQAIVVNFAWSHALKMVARRERPDGSNRVSFPSGHASNAFAAATVIARHYPRLSVPGFGVASYIAISRMAANKHHFSDVVAGAGFGYGVGRLVVRRNSRAPDVPVPHSSLQIAPDGGPSGDGTGLRLVFSF